LFHGDNASLLGDEAHALDEILDARWRAEGFELLAVSLQTAKLAVRDGVGNPELVTDDKIAELLTGRSANACSRLSGNVRKDVGFELVGHAKK